ncbi:leucine-rich repeat domain-containing protein [Emticicia sp. BO119]|uniref:leucine-rich repeat domain-containing protein n=1 Tax=Emticicia sp. BO119 TaxID=2757768 RepID=UPI0015F12278|nr:leucine-rich repeat domain-containing protein [Emticicia sp. BO119]MBA4849780.1 leucine-rich repeat domain-containing protein [Emticicia sp. BO119]
MKYLFCLFLFISICSYGQQKVYRAKDFEKEVFPPKIIKEGKSTIHESTNPYRPLSDALLDIEKNKTVILEVETKKIYTDFYSFANKRNVKFYQLNEAKSFPVELLVQPDGTIDYFVYGYQGQIVINNNRPPIFNDSLNAENKQKFHAIVEEFCKIYRLPNTLSKEKFSITFLMTLGNQPKKPSKMFIYNLEMAEACDKPDTVKTLMLNGLHLETFPMIVFKFKNLEKLDLSNNYIEKIPKSVSKIKNLKFLSLSSNPINNNKVKFARNNQLKDLNLQYTGIPMLPRGLSKNRKLEVLFLGNNRFKGFRKRDFKKMDNLKALNLYNANLSELPLNVTKLPGLEELDLYYNNLKQLPNEICNMPKLKTLAVSNNELWNLPANIAKIKTLETLYAHHNRLNDLPTLPDLKLLHISYNIFRTIPDMVFELNNLVEIDMSKNQIMEVPIQLRKFEKLQRVFFEGNDFNLIAEKKEELAKLVTDLEKKDILVR